VVVVVILGVSTIPISPVLLRLLQPAITISLVCQRGRCRALVVAFYRLSSILIALIAILIENVDFIGLRMIAGISWSPTTRRSSCCCGRIVTRQISALLRLRLIEFFVRPFALRLSLCPILVGLRRPLQPLGPYCLYIICWGNDTALSWRECCIASIINDSLFHLN
jgi:hypothetical protein